METMVSEYLARIGYQGAVEVGLPALRGIQRSHLQQVPYENLDLLHRVPLSFDTQRLWDKIVAERRGGVCYELNFLLGDMLRKLGFRVDFLSGIVAGGAGGDFAHALLLVHLPEGDCISDVGFSRGYLTPLRLCGGWQNDGRWDYRLRRDGEWHILERKDRNAMPVEEYRFTLKPRQKEEYREMCDFLCTSPKCKFTRMLVCTRELPEGRLSLRDDSLWLERIGGGEIKYPVPDRAELNRLLRERFGLNAER